MSYLDYGMIYLMMALLLSLDYLKIDRRIYLFCYIAAFVTLSLFSGLRIDGPDVDYYRDIYVNSDQYLREADTIFSTHVYKVETGYFLVGYLFRHLGCDFFTFQLIVVTCTLAIVFRIAWAMTDRPSMFVFLYFCSLYVTKFHAQIRNAIALSLFLLTYYLWAKRNVKLSFITLWASLMFHTSLIINYVLMALAQVVKRKSLYLLLLPLVFFAVVAGMLKVDIVDVAIEKALFYYNWEYDFKLGPAANVRIFMVAVFAGIGCLLRYQKKNVSGICLVASVIAVAQYVVFYNAPDFAVRFLDNMMPFIIYIYMTIDSIVLKNRKLTSYLSALCVGAVFYIAAIRLVRVDEIHLLRLI